MEEAEKTPAAKKPNLARWFWGSIILMATLSILLSVAAVLRQNIDLHETGNPNSTDSHPQTEATTEASASELESQLNRANKAALESVKLRIGPLLDAAYQPAYEAIPAYAAFHYSVWGEYAELSEAALGDVSSRLQEILFSGLETQLNGVGVKLDSIFNSTFQAELEIDPAATGPAEISLGPLTRMAVEDAVNRMRVTVPVSTAAALGTGAAIKVAATAMAKKIAVKLAVKAAAKTGGKLAAAVTGAGTGAALCSWSGPGAGLCAAVGGVGAWIVADYGIVKLDEYWNRDEFEADLRKMVDEQKAAQRQALEQALAARAIAVQEMSDEIVQQHDFTLRELSGVGNAEICEISADLTARYELMRKHLRERKPEALQAFRGAMAQHAGNLSLGRMVREIEQNLNKSAQVTVSAARIAGNLPADYRADRDISGRLYFNGKSLDIPKTRASESNGFTVDLAPGTIVSADQPLTYAIAIEQHLTVWSNPYFGGAGKVKLIEAVATSDGLEHSIRLLLFIAHDADAGSIGDVTAGLQTGQIITLTLQLRAEPLAELKNVPDCR